VLRRLQALVRSALALIALSLSAAAAADSWAPPARHAYYSANRAYRLTVTPHIPADRNLWPFTGRPRGPSAPDQTHAVLEHHEAGGRWRAQWRGPLRNPVMPVEAMVSDSGRYFVTFDDWGGRGYGPNVVVIYDGTGRPIRALSILDLLPEPYVRTLPSSFSSIYWHGQHSFSADGETLQLSLALPGQLIFPGGYFTHSLTLETGEPGVRAGAEWDRAMAASAAWRVAEQERRATYLALKTEPLLPPRSTDAERWQEYFDEVLPRLVDRALGVPMVILFRRPPAEDYVRWGGTPRATLLSRTPSTYMMIASPEGAPLAPGLAAIVAGKGPGWLRHSRLFIVAEAEAWPDLLNIMGPSGATLTRIDPTMPIRQRPDRLPDGALDPETKF
jgi:hypothetical protein